MFAEPAAQIRLLDLAAVDTEIDQLRHKIRTLPEHADIKARADEHKVVVATLVAATTALSDAEYALKKAESDIEPVLSRISRNQKRLDTGAVTDPKTVSSMVDETAHLKQRLAELEDVQLEAMELVEDTTARRNAAQAERDRGEAKLRELVAVRDAKAGKLKAEISDREAEREALIAELPADLLAAYDKARERSGLGAAKLFRGQCTGCSLQINPDELGRIKAALSNEVVHCEECGRILVRTADSGI